ncbi:hypothetical protein HQ531_04170 [bacterium]|nr:hypothetical protein [bacterium]
MLVAVLMILVVFSFTGVAVLNVSYLSSSATIDTKDNIKMQYAVESNINEALWRINAGVDSLVNFSSDGVTCSWESSSNILSVSVDNFIMESEILLDLSEDTHFDRALASSTPITTNGYTTLIEDQHQKRQFSFLPQPDIQFFLDNADVVHHGNGASWHEASLVVEGIHVFTGNNLDIADISLNNSTLIFLGKNIIFNGTNVIKAPIPLDSIAALPALMFTNPEANLVLAEGDSIEGAIFCAGSLSLGEVTLSGPVVAQSISLTSNIDFMDGEYEEYFRWTKGFGNQQDYDWPKQIGRWKTLKWNKTIAI